MEKTKIRYDEFGAALGGEMRHAQTVMKELGITYERAIPQSMFDCWMFYGCSNIPDDLPKFIKPSPQPADVPELTSRP